MEPDEIAEQRQELEPDKPFESEKAGQRQELMQGEKAEQVLEVMWGVNWSNLVDNHPPLLDLHLTRAVGCLLAKPPEEIRETQDRSRHLFKKNMSHEDRLAVDVVMNEVEDRFRDCRMTRGCVQLLRSEIDLGSNLDFKVIGEALAMMGISATIIPDFWFVLYNIALGEWDKPFETLITLRTDHGVCIQHSLLSEIEEQDTTGSETDEEYLVSMSDQD